MASKLLFTIPLPEKLEERYDPMTDSHGPMVFMGWDVYVLSPDTHMSSVDSGEYYVARVEEFGPKISAIKKYRRPKLEELSLK